MKCNKLFHLLGNLTVGQSKTYSVVLKNEKGEWVEATVKVNHKTKQLEVEKSQSNENKEA